MVEIKQMPIKRRKALVNRINKVMKVEFGIEQESINGFWEVFMAGAEKTEMA
jgi:hypothetical protein